MKKLYVSADIEGTCGIVHWNETEKGHGDHAYFAAQMTREAAAACEGAHDAGFDEALVKDAHDSARNIDPQGLPMYARLMRGWTGHPYCMMAGLDATFSGVAFTGYHAGAGMPGNPLSHTMDTCASAVTINGELASELMINCLIAAYERVPVLCVAGDQCLCDWLHGAQPNIPTVATFTGIGGGAISLHPDVAVARIRETVREAARMDAGALMFPLPERFHIEIVYKEHQRAYRSAFYPGALQKDARTVSFDADDLMDMLRFIQFVL